MNDTIKNYLESDFPEIESNDVIQHAYAVIREYSTAGSGNLSFDHALTSLT